MDTRHGTEDGWRELVDLDRLATWMDSQDLPGGPIESPCALAGGTQNVMLRFKRGGRTYVLRRPPMHPQFDGNRTIRREARVLLTLDATNVPHPRVRAVCENADVLGAAFYLMDSVDGVNVSTVMPAFHANSSTVQRAMGFSLVDSIAALGNADHVALGLADFGKADGFLERQARRWRALLDSYRDYPGWTGAAELPAVNEIADWIEANRPTSFRPGIMHGDYHIANVLFAPNASRVVAIVDWELSTVGDPLLDLGGLLATWPDAAGKAPTNITVMPWQGFPGAAELIEHYTAGSTRDLSALRWYVVLACFKRAIVLEGTWARACAGRAPIEMGRLLHSSTGRLLQRALQWIETPGSAL